MKNLFKTVFIILALVFAQNFVLAQTLDADYIETEVIKAVEKDMINKGFSDIDVKVLGIPFKSLELPDGQMRMVIVENHGSGYSKRCIKALRIYVNNTLVRSFGVPLEIKAYTQALVATKGSPATEAPARELKFAIGFKIFLTVESFGLSSSGFESL